jgi:hypothetical protein
METALLKDLVDGVYEHVFVVCIGRIWAHKSGDLSTFFGTKFVMVDRVIS